MFLPQVIPTVSLLPRAKPAELKDLLHSTSALDPSATSDCWNAPIALA
jgi:hypothetical protein